MLLISTKNFIFQKLPCQIIMSYTLNLYSFVYVNYISTKQEKNFLSELQFPHLYYRNSNYHLTLHRDVVRIRYIDGTCPGWCHHSRYSAPADATYDKTCSHVDLLWHARTVTMNHGFSFPSLSSVPEESVGCLALALFSWVRVSELKLLG